MDHRYKEALERARKGMPIDEVFPELKESGDERIRNLIYCLIRDRSDNRKLLEHNGVSVDDALSYLEKQKEQKTVNLNDDITLGLDRALQIIKDAKGILVGYQTDDGVYECDHAIQTLEGILKNGIEQQPAEWSEEDEKMLERCISKMANIIPAPGKHGLEDMSFEKHTDEELAIWLKSLPERFNLQSKQESEPMEIKYAGKIYKVYGTKEFPGGVVGYKIKDEPGQFDYIINPDEVLGGGYDIKSNGSFYPAKEANLSQKEIVNYVIDSLAESLERTGAYFDVGCNIDSIINGLTN